MSPRLLLVFALLVLPATHAQQRTQEEPSPEQLGAQQAYLQRVADTLATQAGERKLALAALLRGAATQAQDADAPSGPVRDAQAQAWVQAAAKNPGGDAQADRLLVAAAAPDHPLRLAAVRRWQSADPGNLVPLLHAGLDVDALLAQARGVSRADARLYEDVRWIASTLRRYPPSVAEQAAIAGGQPFHGDEAAAITAMVLWAANATPAYAVLVEGCGERMLRALPARRADCRHVAAVLSDTSTTIAGQHAGLAMLHALAADAGERAQVASRQRRMDWRMLQWGRLAREQPRGGAAQFVRLLSDPDIRTEQQLVARVLAEAGVPSDPPPGWTPPRR